MIEKVRSAEAGAAAIEGSEGSCHDMGTFTSHDIGRDHLLHKMGRKMRKVWIQIGALNDWCGLMWMGIAWTSTWTYLDPENQPFFVENCVATPLHIPCQICQPVVQQSCHQSTTEPLLNPRFWLDPWRLAQLEKSQGPSVEMTGRTFPRLPGTTSSPTSRWPWIDPNGGYYCLQKGTCARTINQSINIYIYNTLVLSLSPYIYIYIYM